MSLPISLHLGLSATLFGGLALLAYRWLLPGAEPKEFGELASQGPVTTSAARSSLAKYAIVAALVVIASAGAVVEDSGASWSAIYLSGILGTSAFVAGIGFVALQGMQFVGRIFGDRLVDRFGQRAVARSGGAIVFLGMGLALAFPTTVGTIVGFGLAGLGVSTLIPAAMQVADEIEGFRPGTGLTIVSWLLRVGSLVSPPIVGAIADAGSLRFGLLIVPLVGALVALLAPVLPRRGSARAESVLDD